VDVSLVLMSASAALCHAKMAKELVSFWAAMFSAVEFVLRRSPNEAF
jgi:hypothetical protein